MGVTKKKIELNRPIDLLPFRSLFTVQHWYDHTALLLGASLMILTLIVITVVVGRCPVCGFYEYGTVRTS